MLLLTGCLMTLTLIFAYKVWFRCLNFQPDQNQLVTML